MTPDGPATGPTGAEPRDGRRAGAPARAGGAGRVGSASGTAPRRTGRCGRASTCRPARAARARAEGAGDSGLARLIELHAFNAAGDAAVAISLAGTLFFQVPTGEARGQVALFLGLTMLPFAIVAPLIGPFLDRFSHGRRWAIGATMAVRGVPLLGAGRRGHGDSLVAVPGRARRAGRVEGVRRDPRRRRAPAAAPRGSPWSRPTPASRWPASPAPRSRRRSPAWRRSSARSGRCATPSWSSSVATILAILLPAKVDSSRGEGTLVLTRADAAERPRAATRCASRRPCVRAAAPTAGRAGCRASSPCSWRSCCARTRSRAGQARAPARRGHRRRRARQHPRHRRRRPCCAHQPGRHRRRRAARRHRWPRSSRPCSTACSRWLLLGLVAGLAQSLAKLSLDATIQRDVPERVRASAFARSPRRTLQLAWVIGGFVGIAMPLIPRLGLGIAACACWRPGRCSCWSPAPRRAGAERRRLSTA